MRRPVVLVAILGVLVVGGCGRGAPAAAPETAAPTAGADAPSAAPDPAVGELDRTVTYLEQLLNDTEGEMAADPTN